MTPQASASRLSPVGVSSTQSNSPARLGIIYPVVTAVALFPLALGGSRALGNSPYDWSGRLETQAQLLIWVPLIALVVECSSRRFNVGAAVYWAWSLVFLGLAPAYQIATRGFPWRGQIPEDRLEQAQGLILLGHLAFLAVATYFGRPRSARRAPARDGDVKRASAALLAMGCGYFAVASIFTVLMGPALFGARSAFRVRVLQIADLPFGGLLYFAVTAGAIAIPAALIAARRHGIPIPTIVVILVWLSAAVVTNPLVGSRFLTGSLVVATAIAFLAGRNSIRWVPLGSILLLILVFPTLDVLRGDGSGSNRIELLKPEISLVNYDFDAFEMGAREVALGDDARASLPSTSHMLAAPVLRWVPILSRPYIGDSGGAVVATATGMNYTNVSMPLWAEGHLVAGAAGTFALMGALGAWVAKASSDSARRVRHLSIQQVASAPGSTALLFIVLRGSLYEVLGYLALVAAVYYVLSNPGKSHVNS